MKKSIKKTNAFLLAMAILAFLTSCSTKTEFEIHNDQKVKNKDYEIYENYDFTNGYAWIEYGYKGTRYTGRINKEGEVLFAFNSDHLNHSTDENGHSYYVSNGIVHIIDGTGNEVNSFELKGSASIVGYGEGHFCTEENVSNFSSNHTLYEIIDENGNVIDTLIDKDRIFTAQYMGCGVFGFIDENYHQSDFKFYCTRSCSWIELSKVKDHSYSMGLNDLKFTDGYLWLLTEYSGYYSISANGTVKQIKMPYGYGIDDGTGIYNGKVVCRAVGDDGNGEDYGWYPINEIMVYDFQTDSFENISSVLNNFIPYMYTADSFASHGTGTYYQNDEEKSTLKIVDGVIVLPLRGEDRKEYVAVVNVETNKVLLEPTIKIGFPYISGKCIFMENDDGSTTVYDLSMKQLFKKDFVRDYSDGASVVYDTNMYIDERGNLLFEEYDFSDVKIITVN